MAQPVILAESCSRTVREGNASIEWYGMPRNRRGVDIRQQLDYNPPEVTSFEDEKPCRQN